MESILIAAPTSQIKSYCQKEWLDHINNFSYKNIELLIVDNSPDKNNYSEMLRYLKSISFKYPYTVQHIKPLKELRETLLLCSNMIRLYFLRTKHTHLFSLETDVFIPYNIIEHLLALEAYVICLPYFHGREESPFILNSSIIERNGGKISDDMAGLENFLFIDGGIKPAFQCGIGCMLMKRLIMEKLPFRLGRNAYDIGFPDAYLHDDMARNNVPVLMDTQFIVDHMNSYENWDKIRKSCFK